MYLLFYSTNLNFLFMFSSFTCILFSIKEMFSVFPLQLSSNKDALRKTWNAKYTLRSHFDGIRALAFHPVDPVLITASEDHTLKLWNLEKTVPAKKLAKYSSFL